MEHTGSVPTWEDPPHTRLTNAYQMLAGMKQNQAGKKHLHNLLAQRVGKKAGINDVRNI